MRLSPAQAPFSRDSDGVYRCTAFWQFDWAEHGFSTRHAANPVPGLTTLKQIHSASVFDAEGLTDRQCEGDALIANAPYKWIGVRTADCVPLLYVDPGKRAVAAVHAGWRGTVASIGQRTVDELGQRFGTRPADLHVAIGPAIRKCCYEVGSEVADQFTSLFPEWKHPPSSRGGLMLDLVEANRQILIRSGVPEEQIYDSQLCTHCLEDDFHSYRRDPSDKGRMISFIARTQ